MSKIWEKKVSLGDFQKRNKLPETPGVYFFLDEKNSILYVGKATSLKDRVRSYFAGGREKLWETRGPKVARMLEKISAIAYLTTDSVLEAMIWEAKLIKEHQPPVNSDEKDDKSYNYVIITKEAFPKVLVVRGRDIERGKFTEKVKYAFGPFLAGGALWEGMKIIRKLFPFRDRCKPFEETAKQSGLATGSLRKGKAPYQVRGTARLSQPCFSSQIGLCPGVCSGIVSKKEYGRNINHIRLFFEGRKKTLTKELEREMKRAAKALEFERAAEMKRTLFGLKHIRDMALIKDDVREILRHRVEAYDVAHLMGGSSVGVRVVVGNNQPAKDEYRMFILRDTPPGDDLKALEEILTRRLKHEEWPLPEIIVIDGAENHYRTAEKILQSHGLAIPLVSVVKDKQHKAARYLGPEGIVKRFKKEILLANSEAHRFALTFHRKRRDKEFLSY